jgi:hypothetical protein
MVDNDLTDVPNLARNNYSYRYILSTMHVFSYYLHQVPLKAKNGQAVAESFGSILEDPIFEVMCSDLLRYRQRYGVSKQAVWKFVATRENRTQDM